MSLNKPLVPITLTLIVGGVFLSLLFGGAPASAPVSMDDNNEAVAMIQTQNGRTVGILFATDTEQGITSVAMVTRGLSIGFHGAHIHENGRCTGDFSSAGDHYNPTGADHPNHAGDLPALKVDRSGVGVVAMVTTKFNVADLVRGNGTSIIVHSEPDNFANIPERYGGADAETKRAGDSGDRIACGEIRLHEDDPATFDALMDEFNVEAYLP